MRVTISGLAVVVLATSGCLLAAAGAGAGGAIYYTDRGVQSVVAAPVERTFEVTRQAFQDLGITESKAVTRQEDGSETRSLEGKTSDRDISIDLKPEGSGTKVDVVVRKSAVTWDKDFAREILNRIVEKAK